MLQFSYYQCLTIFGINLIFIVTARRFAVKLIIISYTDNTNKLLLNTNK